MLTRKSDKIETRSYNVAVRRASWKTESSDFPAVAMVDVQEKPVKRLPPYFAVNCFPFGGLSHAVFSGPDGLSDYRAPVPLDKRPIANYQFTSEGSYDAEYIWRGTPLPGTPVHLRPRSAFAGEIGWHTYVCRDPAPVETGHQILTSEFWRQSEDRGSHRHQDVWYPGPGERGKPEQSYYFSRFPNTRPRPHSSFDSRYNMVGSAMTPKVRVPPQQRPPSATKAPDEETNIISVEPSEEGDGGHKDVSANRSNRLLKTRQTSAAKKLPESSSSNSYTTYMRLPSPSSSHTQQHNG